MRHPSISVVIPTRNRPGPLAAALASVTGQRDLDPRSIEVIVVNDGGCSVAATVAAASDGLPVKMIDLGRHHGLPAARNAGLAEASGQYLALLDDDDIFLPHHLRTALDRLERYPADVDLVYTTCCVSPVRVDPTALVHTAEVFDLRFDPGLLEVANFIPVHSAVFRSPRAGTAAFDTTLTALEDWDFWLQLNRRLGYRFGHLHEATVVYHRIPEQATMTGAAATEASELAEFGQLAQRIWQRWPATSPQVARFRAWTGVMYWHALSLLVTDRRPTFSYYLRSLRVLASAWSGAEAEETMLERLAQAVTEEVADANIIA